ncbi:MAG: DUF4837 family protein [Flavobacterium sp.]|uniref:DUF4837 family protein n=1 Tax=Flavobacterium sp. TaxID=239 RepID=UPI0012134E0C|nr:DUF4837 family protein [Flavobacterium sp.]RZJ67962.1 MAG: DUF4837 family protein [Flavobacterium sp.]
MKKALFLLLLLPFAFAACDKKVDKSATSAKINEVSIIIDDQLWKGEIGDSLRNKFASPVIGLPQEEPLFTINQYPVKLFEGYMTDSRNIIVIKKGEPYYEIREDQFTKPQNVVYIHGKTTAQILDTIEKNYPTIIQKIRATEIRQAQQQLSKHLPNDKSLDKKFKIALDIPQDYKIVMQRRRFLWFKKEITSGSMSVIAYEVPASRFGRDLTVNDIVKSRDSIGKRYIHGTKRNTEMVTENSYAPYFATVKLDGRTALETRGNWELNNDFMSGPFLNYCIYDGAKNRYIVIEGFCYAPSREKRDLMFELEAMLKSVRFTKKK